MKVKFIQQHTLGDVLFLQKAVDLVLSLNHEIYLPNDNSWIGEYIKKNNLYFYDADVDCVIDFHNVVEPNHPYDVMTYKYEIVRNFFQLETNEHTSYKNWQKHLIFDRKYEKEENLYFKHLGISEKEDYILKNCNFSKNQTFKFDIDTNLRIVDFNIISDYTMLDWCKVVENAREIWTIDTSLNYLVESLDTKAEKFVVFPRNGQQTINALSCIWNKNWEWK